MSTERKLRIIGSALFIGVSSTLGCLAGCPEDGVRLNEISFLPTAGQHQWVELVNTGDAPAYIGGAELLSNAGSYRFPSEIEPMPKSGVVVVYFDGVGAGANDYNFDGDNRAEMHTAAGTVDILGSPIGFCSLYKTTGTYSKQTLMDFVAWGGEPGDNAQDAMDKGIWPDSSTFVATSADSGLRISGPIAAVEPGGVIARPIDSVSWDTQLATDATPGQANTNVAVPVLFRPSSDAWLEATPSMLLWSFSPSAISFHLQVSENSDFTSIAIEQMGIVDNSYNPTPVDSLPPGEYWWRVRATDSEGSHGAWSVVRKFKVGIEVQPEPPTEKKRTTKSGIHAITGRITDARTANGLAGVVVSIVDKASPGATQDSTISDAAGRFSLSVPAGEYRVVATSDKFTLTRPGGFDATVLADIATYDISAMGNSGVAEVGRLGAKKDSKMLVVRRSSYGRMCNRDNTNDQAWDQVHANPHNGRNFQEGFYCWAVSSVMIARYYGGNLTRDEVVFDVKNLGYGSDNGAAPSHEKQALKFALNASSSQINYRTSPKFSEEEITTAIDGNRPVFYVADGHVETLDAYEYRTNVSGVGELWCRFVNTDNLGSRGYEHYGRKGWWRGAIPETGLTGRSTDARVALDSDGDGVCDFDEEERFIAGKLFPRSLLFWGGSSLNKNESDTDGDGIDDKSEIASYVFPRGAENGGAVSGFAATDPDPDNDSSYPPTDKDSDDGGIEDGDEDADSDGRLDTEERDIFDPEDDGILDLVFCIDTTGSMGGDIEQVKVNAVSIVNNLSSEFAEFRVALVDYRDFPDRTGDSADYPAKTQIAFSDDKAAIIGAINSLSLGYGGDGPETVYSGVMHALNGNAGEWRKEAKKAIIVMGDAPPLDPEPQTGYTLLTVAVRALIGGVAVSVKSDDDEFTGPVPIYSIPTASSAIDLFTDLATETGGEVISAPSPSDVVAAIESAIGDIAEEPSVDLQVDGGSYDSTMVVADASRSVDFEGCGIVAYEWDWDGDGSYDESTLTPIKSHAYPDGFKGKLTVRVSTVSGKQNTDTYLVLVPEFLDVTDDVDLETFAARVDVSTGAVICDIELGNKTESIKTLKDKFYFVLPATAEIFLASPDGTLDDGTPYVDITAAVEEALPGIGNGDLNLDPGETVLVSEAISIFTRDRTIPRGFVFAVWADPPPTTGGDGPKRGHMADVDDDFVIDDFELLQTVDSWSEGQAGDFRLLEAIELWRAGGYEWDEVQGKFVPAD